MKENPTNQDLEEMSLEAIEAIQRELELAMDEELAMRGVEDDWFGEKNALALREELDEEGELSIPAVSNQVRQRVAKYEAGGQPTTPEQVIDALQEEGRLPESIHTPTLVNILKFLGEKMGLRVVVDGDTTMFPTNPTAVELSSAGLAKFLKRGAIAGSFVGGLLMSTAAFAQQFQPGMNPLNDPNFQSIAGTPSEDVWHPEYIVALLLLLGLSAVAVTKLWKNYKKNKVHKAKKKEVAGKYKTYQTAVVEDDREKVRAAKKGIVTATMVDLPESMEDIDVDAVEINEDDLDKALRWKKKVDIAISDATLEIEKAMILPKKPTIKNLNKKRDDVFDLLGKMAADLYVLFTDVQAAGKSIQNENSYLKSQLKIESQKVEYFLKYLELMKKKWLVFVQNAKNEVIQGVPHDKLSSKDQVQQDILKLKGDLSNLLDKQAEMDPNDFKEELVKIEDELSKKVDKAKKEGISGYAEDAEKVDGHELKILDGGKFNHKKPIHYEVDGDKVVKIPLEEDFEVQMWIDPSKAINLNLNFKGNLIATENLEFNERGELCVIGANGQTLQEYIEAQSEADEVRDMEEARVDVGPEAELTLKALASAVDGVNHEIANGQYKTFGRRIEADDDAIKYHLMRVHREYSKGKPNTVLRFTLSEKYWKKALAHLDKQSDLPKHSVNFNYENSSGGSVSVGQPMRRFNVVMNKKSVSVLIPTSSQMMALAGEVRMIFDPNVEYSEEEIQNLLAAVVERLGIAPHIKPVSTQSIKKEQDRLASIRKDQPKFAATKGNSNPEYAYYKTSAEEIDDLRQSGLDKLESVMRAAQLFATTTRWAKGYLTHGMSSQADMVKGGAEEVFTRIHTKGSASSGNWYAHGKPALIFSGRLFARGDCYCYTSDKFGAKNPSTFMQRVSPKKLVSHMSSSYNTGNEVMFHDAVGMQDLEYVVYSDPKAAIKAIQAAGVTEIGGKPLHEAVITPQQFSKLDYV